MDPMGLDELSFVWEGLPSADNKPVVSLPQLVKSALSLTSRLVLLTKAGDIVVFEEGEVTPLEIEPQLGKVRSIRVLSQPGHTPQQEQEEAFICLLESGDVYKVCLGTPVRFDLLYFPGVGGCVHVVEDSHHQICCDSSGSVWSRGSAPFSGLVHQAPDWQKIPFFSGKEVLQLDSGIDFDVCIVKPNESLQSPEHPVPNAAVEPDGPSCPLGLTLETDCNRNFTKAISHDCDKHDPLRKADLDKVSCLAPDVSDIAISLASKSSSCSSIMHQLNLEQEPLTPLEDRKSSSEPPSSGRSSKFQEFKAAEDFEVLEGGYSSTWKTSPAQRKSLSARPSYLSNVGREASIADLSNRGAEVRNTEVWTWGKGSRGQLGQGDMLSRPSPVPVLGLATQYILKVSVGGQHALALTGSGQAFGWGNNTQGQSNPSDSLAVVPFPSRISLPRGETVRDVLAVDNTSLLVCDSGNIYHTGGKAVKSNKSRLHCLKLASFIPQGTRPVSVLSQSNKFIVNMRRASKVTCQLISIEKNLLDQIESVSSLLTAMHHTSPSSKKTSKKTTPLLEVCSRLETAKHFLSLCVCQSLNHLTLAEYYGTGLYRNIGWWRSLCEELGWQIGNCIASDTLLLDSQQTQHYQHQIVDLLLAKFHLPQSSITESVLEQLLLQLYTMSEGYIKCLMELHTQFKEEKELMARISDLMGLHQRLEKQRRDAEDTRSFWKSAGSKIEDYWIPNRRLVLDNRSQPISILGALSKRWIVLMSDVLLEVGYSVTAYSLTTIWLEKPPPGSGTRFEILLTMPEETRTLVTPTPGSGSVWWKALLQHVAESNRKRSNGSNLPPVTRSVVYEFQKGDHRGAVYTGAMTQGKMNGKGSLKYTDGSHYTGEWRNGSRHGFGTFKAADGSLQEGEWRLGRMTGVGTLRNADGTLYEGDLVDAQPQGHGIKKEGKFMGQGACMYIGEWDRGVRHGYGVLEDIMSGEKYMGMWLAGLRRGKGCVVNSDGIYYEGNFVANKLTGGGTMIFEDGAVYEGEFYGAGEFSGKGILTTKTDRYEGVFHGTYADGMRFNGVVYKHNTPGTPVLGQNSDKIVRCTILTAVKWVSLFVRFEGVLGTENPWAQIAVSIHQKKLAALSAGAINREEIDYMETIPGFGQSGELEWTEYHKILRYLSSACTCAIHPFYQVIKHLAQCFNASYGGVRSHPILLPHAKEELEHTATRLYASIRRLFPALPTLPSSSSSWIHNPEAEEDSMQISANSLLFPMYLPSVYPTLFHLYIQREDKLDQEYWSRILRWNRHSDAALLTFFDVDISLWEQPEDPRSRDQLFLDAVYALQRLKTTFTPVEKLEVIVQMFKAITEETVTGNHTWSMDSLLPVCMYVVVRARVLQLGAELSMLSDLTETYLFQGEKGIMFTTLQAAYTQILRENVFIN